MNKEKALRVLQFGEGNFLRAFVDWMIQKANDLLDLHISVVVVQPLAQGMAAQLKHQDCKYHVILEGIKDGQMIREIQRIDCVADAVNPYTDYDHYRHHFLHPELEVIISNTTEAGISRKAGDDIFTHPPASYPAKLVALLYDRFNHFEGDPDKGLSIICCELIENNGSVLKEIVLELASANDLSEEFLTWLHHSCSFCNSLVDRIVTGFPKDNIAAVQKELGTKDNLVVVGEYFHLWAIEGDEKTKSRLPLHEAGLNVLWLDDLKSFRDKKVRVLNGAHTALVPIGLLAGHETVKEAFSDKTVAHFIHQLISKEVLPNIKGDDMELQLFANEILERFHNPYIKHYLKDISLNSLSKWVTRIWPSLKDDYHRTGQLPQRLSVSLAALIILYASDHGLDFKANDTSQHFEDIQSIWSTPDSTDEKVVKILSKASIWGSEIAGFGELHHEVAKLTMKISELGIKEVITQLEVVNE